MTSDAFYSGNLITFDTPVIKSPFSIILYTLNSIKISFYKIIKVTLMTIIALTKSTKISSIK